MGLLDQVFGGGSKQGGGGMSPLMLALLGLLAYKTFAGRIGGGQPEPVPGPARGGRQPHRPDDRETSGEDDLDGLWNRGDGGGLGDIVGGGSATGRSGRSSGREGGDLGDILGSILGGGTQSRGGGGLGDILGSVLGGGRGAARGGGGLGDILGPMLGGAGAGTALSGGLGELLRGFQQSGRADVADSWVQTGPNRLVSGTEVEAALDPQVIDLLAAKTGLSREQVLDRIASELPETIDKLTPEGRLPTQDEAARWV